MHPRPEGHLGLVGAQREGEIVSLLSRYRAARHAGAVDVGDFLAQAAAEDRESLLIGIIEVERTLSPEAAAETFQLASWIERFPQHAAALKRHYRITTESSVNLSMVSTVDRPPDAVSQQNPPPPLVDLPRKLGRYELRTRLGSGTFGEVWRAHDPELWRDVALKIIRPDRHWTEQAIEDFLKEGRRLARVQSPSVVSIFDVGRDSGISFLVSQLIEGETLAARLQRGPLAADDAAALVATVAEAAHAAHLKDIVHRDIKPANILIDREGRPYLADFGLAASYEEQLDEIPAIVGTMAYMSPEQAEGRSHLVDNRTDIYSLGAVLYELLTGRRPFEGRTFEEYIEQVQTRPARPLRTINDSISPELERVCLKALSTSANDRYTTALDLSKAIRSTISLPSQRDSHPPEPEDAVALPTRFASIEGRSRSRFLGIVGGIAVGVAAVILLTVQWGGRQGDKERDHPEAEITGLPPGMKVVRVLDDIPKELIRSKDGAWHVDVGSGTLHITSLEESAVLSLYEVSSPSWELSLTLRLDGVAPRSAPMETCLFFGVEKSGVDGERGVKLAGEVIAIRPAMADGPATIRYGLTTIYATANGQPSWSHHGLGIWDIALAAGESHRLKIRCDQDGLASVTWDEEAIVLPKIGPELMGRRRPLLGNTIGVVLMNGTATIGRVTIAQDPKR